jgi:hypothetical protein
MPKTDGSVGICICIEDEGRNLKLDELITRASEVVKV